MLRPDLLLMRPKTSCEEFHTASVLKIFGGVLENGS